MLPDDFLCFGEDITDERCSHEQIHNLNVAFQHRVMKLRYDEVLVVAWIADESQ